MSRGQHIKAAKVISSNHITLQTIDRGTAFSLWLGLMVAVCHARLDIIQLKGKVSSQMSCVC